MGPLNGVRIVEMGGIGPGPYAGMMLADMGAEILRIERPGGLTAMLEPRFNVTHRGRRSLNLDIKHADGVAAALDLMARADALIEGFRPGVMESLGLGPEVCLKRNPGLVYGRITGWGQDGPLAHSAGHDINYISLTGALHAVGRQGGQPVPPLNLVADFGGGGMLLAFGVVCALFESRASGRGQVVDAAMVDGSASLMSVIYGLFASGLWTDQRGCNLLDSGAHFYDTYETSDGKWVSVGSLEPQFYGRLLELMGIDDLEPAHQFDRDNWPAQRKKLAEAFKTKTRDQWCDLMEGSECCFAPVLSLSEAPNHPHIAARGTFIEVDGVTQPAPVPRFSRTPGSVSNPPPNPGEHTESALADWGFSEDRIAGLKEAEII